MAPAAIRKVMPPSIGTHGGGQHPGAAPVGGGGGGGWAAAKPATQVIKKSPEAAIRFIMACSKNTVNVVKKNVSYNCY